MGVGDLGLLKLVLSEVHCVHDVVPEGSVASGCLVLVVRHEESLAAAGAGVDTCVLGVPVVASEGPLETYALSEVVLVGSDLVLQLRLVVFQVLVHPLLVGTQILKLPRLQLLVS